MLTLMVIIFVIAYAAIALEHPLKVKNQPRPLWGQASSGLSMLSSPATIIRFLTS